MLVKKILPSIVLLLLMTSLVSAGVGLRWEEQSRQIYAGERTCMTYSVYNPFDSDEYVAISVSEELETVLDLQELEGTLIPAQTSSSEAVPVEFCFTTPEDVYPRDCWVGSGEDGSFNLFCKTLCEGQEQKAFEGEVVVSSVPAPQEVSGAGGSATAMAVSAPLNLRVQCRESPRNLMPIYLVLVVVALVGLYVTVHNRKPKAERYAEEMEELQKKMKGLKKKKKK